MIKRLVRLFLVGITATVLVGVIATEPAFAVHSVTTVSPTSFGQGATDVELGVNGTGFSSTGGAPVVSVSGTGVTVSNTVMDSATHLTATLSVASDATLGLRNVTVSQGPGGVDTASCTNCLTITQKPTITAPSPSALPNTNPNAVTINLSGTNFQSGADFRLAHAGFDDIVGTNVQMTNGGAALSASFVLAGQPAAFWQIQVTNPDGGPATFGNGTTTGFQISGSSPTVTNVQPATRAADTTGTVLTLTGTNFARGATITFDPNDGGTEIIASDPTWVSLTSYQVTVDIASDAALGARDVTLTNFDSLSGTCTNCFTVTAKPSVTSITPSSLGQGATSQDLDIAGTGFVNEPTVGFSGTGITVNDVTFVSSTHVTVNVTIASGATTSARTVTVTNPDGGFDTTTFTVNPKPTVASATPASRGQNATNQDIVIAGTNFVDTPTVSFSGSGISVNDVTFDSATQLTVNVTVASDATVGARNVTVTNPDMGTGTGTNKFTVTAGPAVSSLSPNTLGQGVTNQTVGVTGTGFADTPDVVFSGTGVTVNDVTFDSSTHLTLDVSVASNATVGSRSITVTNPDEGNSTTSNALTIGGSPTIDTLTPSSLGQGATADIVLTGTNFVATPDVDFSGTGVSATNVVLNSSTSLTVTVQVSPTATPGARDVTVTNPDNGNATKTNGFTVVTGPDITSITPSSGVNTSTATITNLAGSGFANNATVQLERNGFDPVQMSGESVTNGGTKITGTFPLSTGGHGGTPVAPGAWTVRVTNPDDNGTDTLTNGFTVAANAPTVTGSYTLGQGATRVLQVAGTNFADGAVASVSGSGVTVNSTTVVSATRVDVSLTATSGATTGARDITVTNTDTQAGTCSGCLTIGAKPTIGSIVPNSRGQGASHQAVVITGTNFAPSPVVTISGTGVTIHTATRDSATQITLDVSVDAAATVGARDVTVTNTDGGAATSVGGFTVNAKPTVTSSTPSSLAQGASGNITLTGTNFVATPQIVFSGTGVTVNTVTFVNATHLTVNVTVASNAPTGARNVTVTNPDQGTSTTNGVLTIGSPSGVHLGGWQLLGDSIVGTPALISPSNNEAQEFTTRSSDNAVTTRSTTGGTWGSASSLGGFAADGPAASVRVAGTADVFVQGGDQALWWKNCANPTCTGATWSSLAGGLSGSPASVSRDGTHIDVFIRGLDNALWTRTFTSGTWGPWTSLGGILAGSPAVTSSGASSLDVAVRGGDGALWTRTFNAGTWGVWTKVGGLLTDNPAIVARPGRVDVFLRGADNQLWYNSRSGTTWQGFQPLGGILTSGPAGALITTSPGSVIEVAGRGNDGRLYVNQASF